MELDVTLITTRNAKAAIALADLCFDTSDERAHFRDTFARIAEGRIFYHDPDMQADIRLLPYFLYSHDGEVSGITGLYVKNDDTSCLWLGWFGVHPAKRGTGIGSHMLSHICKVAAGYGASELALYTSEHEVGSKVPAFYHKNGFTSRGTEYRYRASNVVEFCKKLR